MSLRLYARLILHCSGVLVNAWFYTVVTPCATAETPAVSVHPAISSIDPTRLEPRHALADQSSLDYASSVLTGRSSSRSLDWPLGQRLFALCRQLAHHCCDLAEHHDLSIHLSLVTRGQLGEHIAKHVVVELPSPIVGVEYVR